MCMEGHACIGSLLLGARQSKSALERLVAGLLYYAAQSEMRLKMQFCMQSEGSTPKKAHVVETRMVFLFQLRGAFFQSARAESCTFPILTISSPFEPGLPRPASQPASQPARILHA